jgi:hypothetical protein
MPLVKTSELTPRGGSRTTTLSEEYPAEAARGVAEAGRQSVKRRALDRTRARRHKAAERVGVASEQMAAGVAEAAAAAEELRRSLEEIAAAGEEAAGAAQESQGAVRSLEESFSRARIQAEASRRTAGTLQALLGETGAQIEASAAFVADRAGRQRRSVAVVATLEGQAASIGRSPAPSATFPTKPTCSPSTQRSRPRARATTGAALPWWRRRFAPWRRCRSAARAKCRPSSGPLARMCGRSVPGSAPRRRPPRPRRGTAAPSSPPSRLSGPR